MSALDENMIDQISTALKVAQIMEKAKEGVPMNEIVMTTTQSGKSKAVTQKEKNSSDAIRRKQVIDRLKKRTLRGENSLAKDISKRIRQCQALMKHISAAVSLTDKEIVAIQRNLEGTYNRASSLVKEIEVLENAIERKKKEDPVISEYERHSSQLLDAIRGKDYAKITELRQYCEKNASIYNLRQKRLKPYLVKACQVRLKFVSEKRRIMRIQFETYSQVVELIAKDSSEGKYHDFPQENIKNITQLIDEIRGVRIDTRPIVDKLNNPLGNISPVLVNDIEIELDSIDETYLNPMGEKVDAMLTIVGETTRAFQDEQLTKQEKGTKSRMAFQEKKDKDH
jgi:hypothetical protein